MKICLIYSSKEGLEKEYRRRFRHNHLKDEIPPDFFAEGDSPATIYAIQDALHQGGHRVIKIEADDAAMQKLEEIRPDLVFNIAEGLFGDFRESYIPMICERLNLPYTGSDPLSLALCLNKARAKEILGFHLIPTPAFRVYYPRHKIDLENIEFPAIIKPMFEGSSKGIFDDSVIDNPHTAKSKIREKMEKYQQPVILEKYLPGREFTVAVWGNGDEIEVLPLVAINFVNLPEGAWSIYSYEAKWIWDTPEKPLEIFQCPAQINELEKRRIEEIACDTYKALNIRDWCRIDVRLDEKGIPHIIELNPLPGILPNPEDNSCFPKAARTAGYSYVQMINRIVEIAAKRNGIRS
ncbi:MAG: D-alanine--D-alanine ligase [Calditrichia bacterium]